MKKPKICAPRIIASESSILETIDEVIQQSLKMSQRSPKGMKKPKNVTSTLKSGKGMKNSINLLSPVKKDSKRIELKSTVGQTLAKVKTLKKNPKKSHLKKSAVKSSSLSSSKDRVPLVVNPKKQRKVPKKVEEKVTSMVKCEEIPVASLNRCSNWSWQGKPFETKVYLTVSFVFLFNFFIVNFALLGLIPKQYTRK